MTVPSLYVFKCLMLVKDNHHLVNLGEHHVYNTRNRQKLSYSCHKTAAFEKNCIYQGIKFFNHLPIKYSTMDRSQYKSNLKILMLKNPLYSCCEFFNLTNL